MEYLCVIDVTSCATLAALYGLDWYKNRKQNKKLARKVEDYNNTKEPLAEQLA